MSPTISHEVLRAAFGDRLQLSAPLARLTSARIGGMADYFVEVRSSTELAGVVSQLWELDLPYVILGGGSNILISDAGVREVVIHNRARAVRFKEHNDPPSVHAESGVNFGALARQAAQKGLSGLEWAAGIPGTVGGAVFGNAGAHGGDMAGNLQMAEILHPQDGRQTWKLNDLDFAYRSSVLKREHSKTVVLAAELLLEHSEPEKIENAMNEFLEHRRRTQPPGASMGSMFKNPPEDYAGRLIDVVGLKGLRVGDAQISQLHGNFFTNNGAAKAADVRSLLDKAREEVSKQFGVELELEIELLGEWN
ncbi:MAG: UDP-N-acetylmuramate dehydrogenase [Chloroflexi bacterium]|nr:MAG: UDP-N-acetylmuramate dehydrogenase [Chloroflexota bacterium]MBL1195999.1 UDP-N-acetylmuramate dehydrogenase [Chloroflexota bacterium]NOH13293.1 UDP-N-acetylmuramate dehydrogenase [Chloroflexota bacterium]